MPPKVPPGHLGWTVAPSRLPGAFTNANRLTRPARRTGAPGAWSERSSHGSACGPCRPGRRKRKATLRRGWKQAELFV